MKRSGLLALVVACGPPHKKYNQMYTAPVRLADLDPPELTIYVPYHDAGPALVYLKSGLVAPMLGDHATLIDSTTTLHVDNGAYVIRRDGNEVVVPGVSSTRKPVVAPNGNQFATSETGSNGRVELVVVQIADGTSRRYLLDRAPSDVPLAWQDDTSVLALIDKYEPPIRIDLASGAITAAPKSAFENAAYVPDPLSCPARGFRLEKRTHGRRTDIVLIPSAGVTTPERVASLENRVVASATNYPPGFGGDGAVNLGKKAPMELAVLAVTPDCRHALFTLEGRVNLLEIATGRYAFVVSGWYAEIPRIRHR